MAHRPPRSSVPWIALFVGIAFALLATMGALTMMVPQIASPETRLTLAPPQLELPRLPHPTLPMPG